jgi:mannose-6-phosphate isomerase-like protein (cupin superfamily)
VVAGDAESQAAQMILPPGAIQGGPDNFHRGSDQWLFVVSGSGSATVEGRSFRLGPGTLVFIGRGERHEIKNAGRSPLRTLNIYVPPAYQRSTGKPLPCGRGN